MDPITAMVIDPSHDITVVTDATTTATTTDSLPFDSEVVQVLKERVCVIDKIMKSHALNVVI